MHHEDLYLYVEHKSIFKEVQVSVIYTSMQRNVITNPTTKTSTVNKYKRRRMHTKSLTTRLEIISTPPGKGKPIHSTL